MTTINPRPEPAPAATNGDPTALLADAVIAVDDRGTIQTWNPAAERLLGYTAQQALGQSLALIIPVNLRPARIAGFHRAIATRVLDSRGQPVLVTASRSDGELVELEMTLGISTQEARSTHAVVAVLRHAGPRPALRDYAPKEA